MRQNVLASSILCILVLLANQIAGAATTVQFNPNRPEVGPFPTDALTLPDSSQKTGLRINLPTPDCQAQPSTCTETGQINELDGFSIAPRLKVRFSGKVNVDTLRSGISIVWLDNLTQEEPGIQPKGHITRINEVQYDPATDTAYAKPDEVLDQHRRYALVITSAVQDVGGNPVGAAPEFNDCIGSQDAYCVQVRKAVDSLQTQFQDKIVAASVFTTLSATAWLEKARDQLPNTLPAYWQPGLKNIFKLASVASITLQTQTQASPAKFGATSMPLYMMNGSGRVAFGSFYSPNFLDGHMIIPAIPTGQELPPPVDFREIPFIVFLPDQPAPAGGYPVVIAGQGATIPDLTWGTWIASVMAAHGFATIAFNGVGWGGGPQSYVMVKETNGNTTKIPYPGRSADMKGNGTYPAGDACYQITGARPIYIRDCFRQTAIDLLQAVRVIKSGMDLDGNGTVDLDPNRIYYSGYSMGAIFGTLFAALSADVRASALAASAGRWAEAQMWEPAAAGGYPVPMLGSRTPPLLNQGNYYDPDSVLRDQPVHLISVPGALDIQEYFERVEWISMPGDALAYGPHLKPSMLNAMPTARVMFQYGKCDRTLPNPFESSLIRAADMQNTTSLYRHDLARAVLPDLISDGHVFMYPYGPRTMTNTLGQFLIFTLALEQQAGFFESDGKTIPNVNTWSQIWFGANLFEAPPEGLMDGLNFLN